MLKQKPEILAALTSSLDLEFDLTLCSDSPETSLRHVLASCGYINMFLNLYESSVKSKEI